MKRNSVTDDLYQKYYRDLQFERAGLFKAIQEKFNCQTVLYPGSFVHITPSFFFPHVVYVDRAPAAQEFFANTASVAAYINSHKTYKRSAYFRFIAQDYAEAMPLREEEFDLLISLFAGHIAQACQKYLRKGGFLLAHQPYGKAGETASDSEFKLRAVIQFRQNKYTFIEENLDRWATTNAAKTKCYLRRSNRRVVYVENEDYYIYERV